MKIFAPSLWRLLTPVDLHFFRTAHGETLYSRNFSPASKIQPTSFSNGFGNVNALKTLEALRLWMLITFRRGFSFLMVKNMARDTIIDIIRYGSFLLHFGVMGGKSCNNKKNERCTKCIYSG